VLVLAKTIYCDKCLKEIKIRSDLVTSTLFFEVIPYHEDCYAKDLKGAKSFFLNNQPLNGFSGNFGVVVTVIIAFVWFFNAEGWAKLSSLLALLPLSYRLYSYFYYERHLEK
jgi:hypothetical protein